MTRGKETTGRECLRVVEWSPEDQCFVGSAPPLIGRCCHGPTEANVLRQLKPSWTTGSGWRIRGRGVACGRTGLPNTAAGSSTRLAEKEGLAVPLMPRLLVP